MGALPGLFSHCGLTIALIDDGADYLFKSSRPQTGTVQRAARQAAGQAVLQRLVDDRHLVPPSVVEYRERRERREREYKQLLSADGPHCCVAVDNNSKSVAEHIILTPLRVSLRATLFFE